MAQHLRIGSVVNWGGTLGAPTYGGAVVTNITDSYVELEWTDPATSNTHVLVRPWNPAAIVEVVTD